MDEYCYILKLNSLPQHIIELDEIYSACDEISKKLTKLIKQINADKYMSIEFIIDTLEALIEQFNDCCDNENCVCYFNEILNTLYEVADSVITLPNKEERKLIQITFI